MKNSKYTELIRQSTAGSQLPDALLHFEVPEWRGESGVFTIYHTPFTLDDVSYIDKQSRGDKARSLAHTIIRKALTEDGQRMFSLADLPFLTREVPSQVIVNIVNAMNDNTEDIDYQAE